MIASSCAQRRLAQRGASRFDPLMVCDRVERAREAEEIVHAIGQGRAMLNDGSYLLLDTDFMVIIGDDWQQ